MNKSIEPAGPAANPAGINVRTTQLFGRPMHWTSIPVPSDPVVREELTWRLWFEHFRQQAWMGVVATGGGLILVEAGLWDTSGTTLAALGMFAASAFLSAIGLGHLVEQLSKCKPIDSISNITMQLSNALFALGAACAFLKFFE